MDLKVEGGLRQYLKYQFLSLFGLTKFDYGLSNCAYMFNHLNVDGILRIFLVDRWFIRRTSLTVTGRAKF